MFFSFLYFYIKGNPYSTLALQRVCDARFKYYIQNGVSEKYKSSVLKGPY